MNHFLDRLQKEKQLPGKSPRSTRQDSLQPLMGNIREWLKEGETSGLLRVTEKRIQFQDEQGVPCLGVDFGGGRLLKVEPKTPAGDRVEMHFSGCRKIGRIVLQHRGEQWWVWPKNSVRQLPVAWSNASFLAMLDDMV